MYISENLVYQTNGDSMGQLNVSEEFLGMREAANYIHVSLSTMEKLSAKRVFPKYRPNNGKVYFKKEDLNKYMLSSRVSSATEINNEVSKNLQLWRA